MASFATVLCTYVEKGEFHRFTITIRVSRFNRVSRVSGVSRVSIRVRVIAVVPC